MTVSIDGTDIGAAIEIALVVGGIIAMLVAGLLLYLLVRPPRRAREVRPAEPDALEIEEMLRLMDVMERRIGLLERAITDQAKTREFLETGANGPDMRRTK